MLQSTSEAGGAAGPFGLILDRTPFYGESGERRRSGSCRAGSHSK